MKSVSLLVIVVLIVAIMNINLTVGTKQTRSPTKKIDISKTSETSINKIATRDLLSQKVSHLKSIKQSMYQVEDLMRAHNAYKSSRSDAYGDRMKQTMDELKEVLNAVQYEVDILSSLCSEKKGPNCDKDASNVNSTTASSQSINMPTVNTSTVQQKQEVIAIMEKVQGVVGSEIILVDAKLSGGKFAKTCKEYLKIQPSLKNGVYLIKPFDDEPEFKVFCDMNNGGYIQFQRRISGEVDFYRKWTDYADGFGNPKTNYWLGLNRISKFTQLYPHSTLRIDLFHNTLKQNFDAQYANFLIDSENRNFALHIGDYNGTLGDSLSISNNMQFSTQDRDNDVYEGNCATEFKGAFWYKACHESNLNGAYLNGKHTSYADGIEWRTLSGYYYSFEKSSMGMIEQ